MPDAPANLRILRDDRVLEIVWTSGAVSRIPFRFLRGRCPCAGCVDEFTGVRRVDVEDVPEDVAPTRAAFSGNYALKITWSDGHDTGLYTWDRLAQLAQEAGS